MHLLFLGGFIAVTTTTGLAVQGDVGNNVLFLAAINIALPASHRVGEYSMAAEREICVIELAHVSDLSSWRAYFLVEG